MTTFAERVKQIRKSAGLNQTEFGQKIGLTYSGVSSIEKGATQSSEQTRRAICDVFNVSRQWLETGDGPMYMEPMTAEELIDEKLANGSEFAKALMRVIARLPDDDLAAVERMFVALEAEMQAMENGPGE